jgi:hypothetical protein
MRMRMWMGMGGVWGRTPRVVDEPAGEPAHCINDCMVGGCWCNAMVKRQGSTWVCAKSQGKEQAGRRTYRRLPPISMLLPLRSLGSG